MRKQSGETEAGLQEARGGGEQAPPVIPGPCTPMCLGISNKEPQNVEGDHFDIRNSLFDILRFDVNIYKVTGHIAPVLGVARGQL